MSLAATRCATATIFERAFEIHVANVSILNILSITNCGGRGFETNRNRSHVLIFAES
jgi:hypothetical protein